MRNVLLKWQGHASALSSNLKKLFFEHMFADVSIACEGKVYPAHKFVLSTCSEYFEEIFRSTHGSDIVVVLKDVSKKDMEYLLEYMYVGTVDISHGDLASFVKASEFLKVKGLPNVQEEEEEREVQTHGKRRLSRDIEEVERRSTPKKKKLNKKKQKSIEFVEDAGSSRESSCGAICNSPTPGSSVEMEATYPSCASSLQPSVHITPIYRIDSPEPGSFPRNLSTTMISAAHQSEVIPVTPSSASKRPPLVSIPTTPTFMHFSASPDSPTDIKKEIDPQNYLEVCADEGESIEQVDFETERWSPLLDLPSIDWPEREQFICRNQEDNIVCQPSMTSEKAIRGSPSKTGSTTMRESSTWTSEDTTNIRISNVVSRSVASKANTKKDTGSKGSASKMKRSKNTLTVTPKNVRNAATLAAKNIIRPCHVVLEQLTIVEVNGVLRWSNPSETSFKSSSHSTQSRPQRGKENSEQKTKETSWNKRIFGTSGPSGTASIVQQGLLSHVTGPIGTASSVLQGLVNRVTSMGESSGGGTSKTASNVMQGLVSHVTSREESSGDGTSAGLRDLSNTTTYVGNTTPTIRVIPCNFCNLTFLEKNVRDMHEYMHHGDFITAICLYCNEAFRDSSLQRTHMLQHDGHVAPLHSYLKSTSKRLKWYFVFLHMGHPCVQLKPESRPLVIRTRLELQKLLAMLRYAKSIAS